ncbi:MAG TPA: hypothetical protein VNL13_02060 [Sulfolobales archaeon]|nr:hypothetical protein [Sulfolobales archaeon]
MVRICIKEALEPGVVSREIESLGIRVDSEVRRGIVRALEDIANTLVSRRGSSLYCRLCRKGPYTKRGAYLHLLRIHSDDIISIVREEFDRVIGQL